jgi:hypothetical protein
MRKASLSRCFLAQQMYRDIRKPVCHPRKHVLEGVGHRFASRSRILTALRRTGS